MAKRLLPPLCLALVAATIFFTNLGATKLWDRDEPRNAGCAAEMLQRGDWVVPRFNAELRPHKPVLLYWFMMTAYAVFGVNELAARFWSAVLAVGTVLVTYAIGRRLFNATVALWAGLILASCLMFDVLARAATPDSVFIFFATSAILVYVLGAFKPNEAANGRPEVLQPRPPGHYFPSSWPLVALMYGIMGVAVLAKGPVGLVLPTAVIGMFLLIIRLPTQDEPSRHRGQVARATRPQNRLLSIPLAAAHGGIRLLRPFAPLHFLRTCWSMRPITALTVALAVALPWYVLVSLRTGGDWLEGFLLTHNLGRALEPMEGHSGSILYYPVALMIGFFPWSVFVVPVLVGAAGRIRRRDPWRAGYVFLACWSGVYLALFSIARTKLPNYIVPAYPACALLTACFLYHWSRGTALARRIWPKLAFASQAIVGVCVLIGLPIAARRYLPGDEWLAAVGLIPIAGAVGCLLLVRRNRVRGATLAFGATAVAFTMALLCFVPVRVDRHHQSDVLTGAIAAHSSEPQIASFGVLEPSWVYYSRRPIRAISGGQPSDAVTFLEGDPSAFLITTEDRHRSLEPQLPEEVTVLATVPYFLKKAKLVVLGRPRNVRTVASQPPRGRKIRR